MKTVVITGANRGIGLGLAQIFLQGGYAVAATARDVSKAAELLVLSRDFKEQLKLFELDVTSDASVENFAKSISTPIDVLINNSGVSIGSAVDLAKTPLTDFFETFDVNTWGPIRVTKAFLSKLNPDAKICHISSVMGSIADNQMGGKYAYRMSKTALNMFNKSLAIELKSQTCVVFHPGWVQTDMGGKQAPTTIDQSVKGIYKVISELKHSQTGKFLEFTGKELPW